MSQDNFITPQWPLPSSVKAIVTTRQHPNLGASLPPYNNYNLATHVGDKLSHVYQNRASLQKLLPNKPVWLNQTHSRHLIEINQNTLSQAIANADGAWTRQKQQICSVLTADCLPLLFCSKGAEVVAAIHAGWRGLALGIIDNAVMRLTKNARLPADELMVWLGPAISKLHFEVGAELRDQFLTISAENKIAFTANKNNKYMADIYLLAKINLHRLGVTEIYGGDYCSFDDEERFYSYRRDGITGRMASLIWKV